MEMEIDESSSVDPMSNSELAKQKKDEGNSYYTKGDYETALNLYTEAIDLDSGCAAYYGNRAATFIMLDKYQQALEDCRHALRIEPEFVKVEKWRRIFTRGRGF
jgi:DnaJ family protein C protein 7